MNRETYEAYLNILRDELVPAMGCTEPIAIALTAATAQAHLGTLPTSVSVCVSGNIIKNVKSVMVPGTGGLRGIGGAVAAGIIAGDHTRELEVLSGITDEKRAKIAEFLEAVDITVSEADSDRVLDIGITLKNAEHTVWYL